MARELLGKALVHRERCGRIVEVEAYVGPDDRASHARVGRKGRAAIMYGPAGFAYVYQIYGMHFCFNVVTENEGYPGAVLVRAIEPHDPSERGSGPALVCRALRITRACDGMDLVTSDLFVADGPGVPDADVRVGPRVGVDYAGEWAAHPWRLWVANSQHISRRGITGTPLNPAMLG